MTIFYDKKQQLSIKNSIHQLYISRPEEGGKRNNKTNTNSRRQRKPTGREKCKNHLSVPHFHSPDTKRNEAKNSRRKRITFPFWLPSLLSRWRSHHCQSSILCPCSSSSLISSPSSRVQINRCRVKYGIFFKPSFVDP